MAKDLGLLSNFLLEKSLVPGNEDRWAVTLSGLAWPKEETQERNSLHLEKIGLFRWEAFTMKFKQRTTWLEQSMGVSKNHSTVTISLTWKCELWKSLYSCFGKEVEKNLCLNCREYLKSYPSLKNAQGNNKAFVLWRAVIYVLARDLFGNFMNLAVCLSYFESLRSLLISSEHPWGWSR